MNDELKIEEVKVDVSKKSLLDLAMRAKTSVDEGQELLLEVYNRNIVDGTTKVLAGADGGSTASRVLLQFGDEDPDDLDIDKLYIIPSSHAETNSKEEILVQSEQLYDKMDSVINDKSPSAGVFDKVRVLRGTKFTSSTLVEEKLKSNKQKIDTPAFYINLIEAIAYGIIMRRETLTKKYEIYIGVSLPPNDANSEANRRLFRNRMLRTFTWSNKDLGIELELEFKGAAIQTEPESNVKAFCALQDEEVAEFAMCVEAGGSTIGSELMKNGKSIKAGSQTFPYGGRQLQEKVVELYREQVGGGAISAKEMEDVLKTGAFKVGRETKDAVPQLVEAINFTAERIFNDVISKCFETQDVIPINYIETIYYSGRLFRGGNFKKIEDPTTELEKLTSYSLMTPLSELFRKEIPSVRLVRIPQNYIPLGNLLNAQRDFGGYVFGDSEEVVKENSFVEEEEEEEVVVTSLEPNS